MKAILFRIVIFLVLWILFSRFVLLPVMLKQVRKPSRWIGRFFLWRMNLSHSNLTNWGLKQVSIEKDFTILDVGCGGGRTIQKMAAIATEGKIYGIDYAEGSVAASRAKNAPLISAGRVEISRASVSELPFPDNKFDLVTAVETQYYWPDLAKDMLEILRVLKPGGTLSIIAESYKSNKGDRYEAMKARAMQLLNATHLTADQHRDLFTKAGYLDVQVFEENRKGWICVTGKRPFYIPNPSATGELDEVGLLER